MSPKVYWIRCRLCRNNIDLPYSMNVEMVPVKDGELVPPFHQCTAVAEPEPVTLTSHPDFGIVKETQRIMSYTETRAMLERLGSLGASVLLKAGNVN